jgi:hypothetical protein
MNTSPNKNLIIISPTAPPEVCGVSDYAYKVGQELVKQYDTVTIGADRLPVGTSQANELPIAHWQVLLDQASAASPGTDVLLNYTPTSFARTGLPIKLLKALRHFTQSNSSNRLFVFFHETWNGSPDLRLHQKLQQRIVRSAMGRVGQLADGVAVVNSEQQQKLEQLLQRNNIRIHPIGSNIVPAHREAGFLSERQPGEWLVFGLPHTRLWAIEAHLPLLKAMHSQGLLRRIQSIGPVDTKFARQEKDLVASTIGPDLLVQLGALAPDEISKQLLRAEAALVGLNSNGLKKSGTFAALAAHAVPIICEVDTQLDYPPGAALFQPNEVLANPGLLTSAEGERRRRQLHHWFWTTRSWEAIGQSLHTWLQETSGKAA